MMKAKEEKLKYGKKAAAVIPIEWIIYENYEKIKEYEKYAALVDI